MIDIAIIASALPVRAPLLERSLHTWDKSAKASGLNYQICVFSEDWDATSLCWRYENCRCAFGEKSGSHIRGYNHWLDHVNAKVYLFTHPDLLFPLDTVLTAYTNAVPNRFVGFKCYWVPEDVTADLDLFPWQSPEELENYPALYPAQYSADHGIWYWNGDVRAKTEWHTTTTWAMECETLQKLLPFPDFKTQGPDDPYFAGARMRLGIEDYCAMNPILFHQWHPQSWNQDTAEAIRLATEELNRRFK